MAHSELQTCFWKLHHHVSHQSLSVLVTLLSPACLPCLLVFWAHVSTSPRSFGLRPVGLKVVSGEWKEWHIGQNGVVLEAWEREPTVTAMASSWVAWWESKFDGPYTQREGLSRLEGGCAHGGGWMGLFLGQGDGVASTWEVPISIRNLCGRWLEGQRMESHLSLLMEE